MYDMTIEYVLKQNTRTRTIRLAVYPDGAVVVTSPLFLGAGTIERFVTKHAPWIERTRERVKRKTVIRFKHADIPELKQRAQTLAHERVGHFSTLYGLRCKKITIRAQKSRWGSCSREGNLNLNYKIAGLPAHITDYIIVHELCHVAHMDHSKKFWDLVAKAVPNHREIRKHLRHIVFVFE
jgi:predicted metal-dependent hydrolase